jgi:voltage-gated potassium channel
LPLLVVAGATVGYHAIERWPWFDALYTSVITLTSMGHEGSHVLSTAGRLFTIVLALGGIFTIAFTATEFLGIIITGEFRNYWEARRMRKKIESLEHHVIVCGHGRIGRLVCADLRREGVPFVVIERREAAFAAARDLNAHALLGDAAEDATLHRAGIQRARALIATAGADADSVLITMTAHLLCPALPIVARVVENATVPKLLRAGATRIVSAHALVAGRLAQAVVRPSVLDLVDAATSHVYPDLQMEERLVGPGSPLDGNTLGSSGLRALPGLIVVAIKHPDGHVAFNPGNDAPVAAGDTLITLSVAAHALAPIGPGLARGSSFDSRSGT